MPQRTLVWLVVAALAVSLAVTAAVFSTPALAGGSLTTVDDDHALADRETIDEYDETGVARASIDSPNMNLTVADSSDDVDVEGYRFDMTTTYLEIEYDETISREIRVFIPSEYWHPLSQEIDSDDHDSETTAEFRPTDDGRYTAVTVDFDDRETAVFEIPVQAEFVFWSRDQSRDLINDTVGVEPPRLATGGEWEYLSPSELQSNETIPIKADGGVEIQQDELTDDPNDDNWIGVPRCSRSTGGVCTYTVDGDQNTVYLLTQTNDPPEVRYKAGTDPGESLGSMLRDLRSIPDRIWDDVSGVFAR